jgi:hypothetical protein
MKLMPRDPYTRRVMRSRAIGALAAAALALAMVTAISMSDSPLGDGVPEASPMNESAPVPRESTATAPSAAPKGSQ